MTALPTSPALDQAVADLVTKVSPWCKIGEALTAIRRLQHHESIEQMGQVPTVTAATALCTWVAIARFDAADALALTSAAAADAADALALA